MVYLEIRLKLLEGQKIFRGQDDGTTNNAFKCLIILFDSQERHNINVGYVEKTMSTSYIFVLGALWISKLSDGTVHSQYVIIVFNKLKLWYNTHKIYRRIIILAGDLLVGGGVLDEKIFIKRFQNNTELPK